MTASTETPSPLRLAAISAATLVAVNLWDYSGLDLALARVMGNVQGFALRDHWLLTRVFHTGAKSLAWLLVVVLCLTAIWPVGWLQRLPVSRRVQLAASALLAAALIALLKAGSQTSCPWDMHDFGGVARYASHWTGWIYPDGGSGQCFPAGHATTGFAFVGGFFALRHARPRLAQVWLWSALTVGMVLGIGQQLRGAHFMSHTLWTGWLCWMTAWLSDPLFAPRGTARSVELRP